MSYKDSRCDLVEIKELWRVYVPSERSWDKTVRLLEKMIKREKVSFYKPGAFMNKPGHQMDLMSTTLTKGEDQLSSSYPDW